MSLILFLIILQTIIFPSLVFKGFVGEFTSVVMLHVEYCKVWFSCELIDRLVL